MEELLGIINQSCRLPRIVGVRLRPPNTISRFGIDLESATTLEELTSLLLRLPAETAIGVHWHLASSLAGTARWWQAFDCMVQCCLALQDGTGRPVKCLDIGGGWHPEDWRDELTPQLKRSIVKTRQQLSNLDLLILEPGKALAQPCMMLAVRVLEIRSKDGRVIEAVVDGSIAELPQAHTYPHRVMRALHGSWVELSSGDSRLLGRLCMEEDVLATGIELPLDIKVGELLVLGDAGAYDASMAYAFGQGSIA